MTRMFKIMQENFEGEKEKAMDRDMVKAISLYQAATSLIEIDNDLKNIITELKKRKV